MKRRSLSRSFSSKGLARTSPFPLPGGHASSLFLIILALSLLFVSAVQPQAFSGVRSSAADALAPVLAIVAQPLQKTALFIRDVSGLAELQAENMRLEQENTRLREWYQAALFLEAENKSLRELLNIKVDPRHSYISAAVLSDSGQAFVKSILVKAGREQGVAKGQAVVSGEGLIGRVIEAGNATSRVLLITDMNSRVPVLVEDSSRHAILAGDNTRYPRMIHMAADSDISEGARIVTSGHGGLFPQGLPVGRVAGSKSAGFYVQPFADFGRMRYVRIINKPGDPNLRAGPLSEYGF